MGKRIFGLSTAQLGGLLILGGALLVGSERKPQGQAQPEPEPQQSGGEPPPTPPSYVPIPEGFKHYSGPVSEEMKRAALEALSHPLGTYLRGGNVLVGESPREWGILLEWHRPYPESTPNKPHAWHKGASILIRSA